MTEVGRSPSDRVDIAAAGPSSRWLVLAVGVLVHATSVALVVESVPPLKQAIAADLGVGWATAVLIYTAFSVGMIATQLPGGAVGDRYPLRYVVGCGAIVAGVATAARAVLPTLAGQVALSLLATVGIGLVNPNLVNAVTARFPPGRLGLAQGILLSGYTVGAGIAMSTSGGVVLSILGSWRRVFLLYGCLAVAVGVLWLLVVRELTATRGTAAGPDRGSALRESVVAVLRAPSTRWAVSLAGLSFWAFLGALSVLPEFAAMHPFQVADAYLGVPLFVSTVGAIAVPVLSDRVGRAPALHLSVLGLSTGVVVSGFAPSLAVFVIGLAVAGFFGGGLNAMFYVLPGSLTDINTDHVGTMAGVVFSLAYVGSVVSTATSARVLAEYGVRGSALFVALPLLLGLYFVLQLRLGDREESEAVTSVDEARPHIDT